MSSDESGSQSLPVATAYEKPERAAPAPAPRSPVLEPRTLLVGGSVALIGVAVLGVFLWMVPNAAAHEAVSACRSLQLREGQQRDGQLLLNPALCPGGEACTAPVPAPEFIAQDMTGKMVRLSDFRGKVVLLNFWASWCGVCKTEKPALNAMASEMANKDGFVVLALASDHNWSDTMTAVLDTLAPGALPEGPASAEAVSAAYRKALPNGTPFKLLLDPPPGDENIGKITASWGIKAVPESALIDRQGNIRAYFVNKRDWQSPVAETCLRSVIDGQ